MGGYGRALLEHGTLKPRFNIRRVNVKHAKDRQRVQRLHNVCFYGDDQILINDGYWWLAFCGSNAAGFCGLSQSWQWCDAGYLCRAGVAPRFRGFGLQKKLIQIRINYAKRLGWNWLITDTTDNPPSSNSLISKGFRLYQPAKPWAYKNSLYWRRYIGTDAEAKA